MLQSSNFCSNLIKLAVAVRDRIGCRLDLGDCLSGMGAALFVSVAKCVGSNGASWYTELLLGKTPDQKDASIWLLGRPVPTYALRVCFAVVAGCNCAGTWGVIVWGAASRRIPVNDPNKKKGQRRGQESRCPFREERPQAGQCRKRGEWSSGRILSTA